MALITVNPTANQNPDTGQPGTIAVTGAINTGHASTTASSIGGGSEAKSCRWFTFPTVGGQKIGATLKVGFQENGTLSGGGAQNEFLIEYSLNGGGAWNTLRSSPNIVSLTSGTASAALSAAQDLTQVQVRDFMEAQTAGGGDSATVTVTVSDIRIEVATVDAGLIALL